MVPNRKLTEMAYEFLRYQGSFQEQQAMKLMSQSAHNKEVIRKPDAEAMKGFLMNFVKVTDFAHLLKIPSTESENGEISATSASQSTKWRYLPCPSRS